MSTDSNKECHSINEILDEDEQNMLKQELINNGINFNLLIRHGRLNPNSNG